MFVVGLPVIVEQPYNFTTVSVNDDAVIECTVSGYGDITITWKKLNSTLPNSAVVDNKTNSVNEIKSILKIPNIIGYYKGYYYATIHNSAGKINSRKVYLDVSSKYLSSHINICIIDICASIVPCPEMIKLPVPTTIRSGETAVFTCLAFSYGELSYQWKKFENSTLPSNAAVQNNITKYLLIISNAQVSNEGNYCCVATNECGNTTSCAWLEVKSK